jgi:ectoine hydroxylase-related dioxygenase (phytanoyl-CoA dioxygenase family)
MTSYEKELETNGYCIIENILNKEEIELSLEYFNNFLNSYNQIKENHNVIHPHGVLKFFEIGHQRHAWYIRTRKTVQDIFKNLWKTDDLVVSFDGSCWLDKNIAKKDNIWTHSDQAPDKKDLKCYQGFVSLTENKERTFVVYEKSHKLHEIYVKEKELKGSKDWFLIEKEYLEKIKDTKKILHVKAGSLVIWDSRTFHQNQYGKSDSEERIVQYISFLPKKNRSEKMKEKRIKYFNERRTTSHWAYPVKVNGLQPQIYGNEELRIDYSKLTKPILDDLLDEINKLI